MTKVLVTGGSGFLASWVIRKLLEQGYHVRTTVRSGHSRQAVLRMLAAENIETSNLSFVFADLTSAQNWDQAMGGVDYVLHLASPLGSHDMDNPQLIKTAVEGTDHVITAAIKSHVKKIIMTSSEAANYPAKSCRKVIDESFWTGPHNQVITNYMRSKLAAEQRAWYLVNQQKQTQLATILPGAIMGPAMGGRRGSTAGIFESLLRGNPSPRVIYPVVDVRDLADLHLLAMESNRANGQRFIAEAGEMTMPEIARLLKQHYPNYKISRLVIPNWLIGLLANWQPTMKVLNTMIGLNYHRSSKKARALLHWQPRPVEDTVLDSANYLIRNHLISKR